MASTGWISPGAADVLYAGESGWTDINNILMPDSQYVASFSPLHEFSDYLMAYDFGFDIPAGATIDGIQVRMAGFDNNGQNEIWGWLTCAAPTFDAYEDGSSTNFDLSFPNNGSVGERTVGNTSGGYEIFWGGFHTETGDYELTSARVNASSFGVIFYVYDTSGNTDVNTYIDFVQVNVHYTESVETIAEEAPSIAASSGGSTSWANPLNVASSDDTYASANQSNTATNNPYLNCSGFGFSIPSSATIVGIEATVEWSSNYSAYADTVQLTKGGTRVGSNIVASISEGLPSSENTTATFGGSNELWATTWTPTEMNATGFGISLRVRAQFSEFTTTVRIDSVKLKVYYTDGGTEPGEPIVVNSQTLFWAFP